MLEKETAMSLYSPKFPLQVKSLVEVQARINLEESFTKEVRHGLPNKYDLFFNVDTGFSKVFLQYSLICFIILSM